MRTIMQSIDINAHINNLICNVLTEGETTRVKISFDNLGFGTISAIKFKAVGYDSFGDVVQLNGKDKFVLSIQDISILPNTPSGELKLEIPNAGIRTLNLQESRICFTNGDVVDYQGLNTYDVELDEYEDISDKLEQDALQSKFGIKFKVRPVQCEHGWICGCGRYNTLTQDSCSLCKHKKHDILTETQPEALTAIIQKFQEIKELERMVSEEKEAQRAQLYKKIRKRCVLIGGAVVVAIIAVSIILTILDRTSFETEASMQNAVVGTYTYYNDNEPSSMIIISENRVSYRTVVLRDYSDSYYTISEWNYDDGTILAESKELIVYSDGDISFNGRRYEAGGSWDSTLETAEMAAGSYISFSITSKSKNSFSGTVSNSSNHSFESIKFLISAKDSAGDTIGFTTYELKIGAYGEKDFSININGLDENSKITLTIMTAEY